MKTGVVRFTLTAVLCALAMGLSWPAPGNGRKPARQTVDDMTSVLTIQHLPDGTVLRKRAFKHAVPWDEYMAAVAAETPGMIPSGSFDEAGSMTTTQCLPPPTTDYDADGFTSTTTPPDGPPLLLGEFIADRPRITAEFRSTIEPSIVVQYTGDSNYSIVTETFQKDDLVETITAKDTLEFKSTFNSPGGIKLNFGFAGLKPTFKVSDFSLGYEFEKKRTYSWTRDKTRTTEDRFSVLVQRSEQGSLTVVADAGKVTGDVIIKNVSDYAVLMRLSSVRIAAVAYSPATGARDVIGQIEIASTFDLNWGENNNFYWLPLTLDHLNTFDMMKKLAEGWVFDYEVASPPSAVDRTTGNDLGALISTINQNNARISIHYGDGTTRQFGQVSVFQPSAANGCLTVKDMLTTFVGAANVEFDRMPDGTLIVKRINHRTNRYADQDFDSLTPDEQNQYGRWVVGYNFYNSPTTQLDLETTVLRPEDKIFFYFVTANDYRETSRPEDFNQVSTIANNGSYPASAVAAPGVSTNDLVEVTVKNTFQIESAYTQYVGTVAACGTMIYGATYHGHRVTTDSTTTSIPIPDADYYGLQIRFGGLPWKSIADIMADPSAKAVMVSFRGYPWYDYTLQFRASPSLLGNYPAQTLQIQTVKPRQSFYPVGYEGTDVGGHRTCYHTEIGGFFRNEATVKVWYKLDNVDLDLDGYYDRNRTGIDFDDTNDRRFPFAPEYLDGVDNDGNGSIDDNPLICPDALQSYQSGTCTLNDRMGWYGPSPNVSMERRWTFASGSTSAWEMIGSGITSFPFDMSGDPGFLNMQVRTTHYPAAGGAYPGINTINHAPGGSAPLYAVGQEFEAESGALVRPMVTGVSGLDTYVHVPAGTTDFTGASAEYRVQILYAGDYTIATRVFATGSGDDSFIVRLIDANGTPVDFGYGSTAHFRFEFCNPPYPYGTFSWTRVGHYNAYVTPVQNVNPIYYHLVPGTYTIQFTPRELGARLDKLRVDRYCPDNDGDGVSVCAGDCNDNDPAIYPGHAEVCSNSIDDDCDGYVNEGCGGGGSPIFKKVVE